MRLRPRRRIVADAPILRVRFLRIDRDGDLELGATTEDLMSTAVPNSFQPPSCGVVRRPVRPAAVSTRPSRSTRRMGRSLLGRACVQSRPGTAVAFFAGGFATGRCSSTWSTASSCTAASPTAPGLYHDSPTATRSSALGASRASVGRQPRERPPQGHAALLDRVRQVGRVLPAGQAPMLVAGIDDRLRGARNGFITPCTSTASKTATSSTSGGTTCTTTARREWRSASDSPTASGTSCGTRGFRRRNARRSTRGCIAQSAREPQRDRAIAGDEVLAARRAGSQPGLERGADRARRRARAFRRPLCGWSPRLSS